jgi:hypothetical protein
MKWLALGAVALALGGCGYQGQVSNWYETKNAFKMKCFQHYGEARVMEYFDDNWRRIETIYCYRDARVIFRSTFNFWTYERKDD